MITKTLAGGPPRPLETTPKRDPETRSPHPDPEDDLAFALGTDVHPEPEPVAEPKAAPQADDAETIVDAIERLLLLMAPMTILPQPEPAPEPEETGRGSGSGSGSGAETGAGAGVGSGSLPAPASAPASGPDPDPLPANAPTPSPYGRLTLPSLSARRADEDLPTPPAAKPSHVDVHLLGPAPAPRLEAPAPKPAPAASPAPALLRSDQAEGHLGARRAEIVVGEGAEKIALQVTATAAGVRVRARTSSSEAASALVAGSGDLDKALRTHGLSLKEMATDLVPGERQPGGEPPPQPSDDDAEVPNDFEEDMPTWKDGRVVL